MQRTLRQYGPDQTVLVVCGVHIENHVGYDLTEDGARNSQRIGMSARGIKTKKKTIPVTVAIEMIPDAPELSVLQAMDEASEFVGVSSHTVIGTLEKRMLFNACLESISLGRRGSDEADDIGNVTVTIKFLDSKG
jgi:hypothetical protein